MRLLTIRAIEFEYRHPIRVHQPIVEAGFGTYFIQRDDIVWQLIKNTGEHTVFLERILFAIATLMVGAAAILCTGFGGVRQSLPGHPDLMTSENRRRAPDGRESFYAGGLGALRPRTGLGSLGARG